jgi:hypothetical protein
MKKRTENTITIFQTAKKSKLLTLPKKDVEKDLGWLVGDKLEYKIIGDSLVLRKAR